MRFDVAGARRAGYSDEEIAQFLARERGFDFDGARKSGYSGSEVLDFLTARAPAAAAASSPDPVDYSDAATAMQGTPMSSPPRQRDSRPAPAPKPAPTPYRNRLEALDDAVNLIEEGVDLKRVASSFNQIGIQEADIVAHGVGRKSPMFADPGLSRRQIDQYVRPTQPASPQITGEVRPVETTLLEDTANLGRRVAARTRQSVANTLFQAGAIDQDGAAQVFAQNQRRIQAAAPPESVQEGLREFGNAETFTDAAIALATNPKATFVALTESLLQTAPALAITALRAPTLLRASSVGASSGALEFGSAMADVLSDRGVDLTNAAAISEALRKPEVVDQIREKGTTRGLTIGAIDALTAGFAGKFLRPVQDAIYAGRMGEQAARRATLGAWGKELGMQVAGGAGGEALAQNLTGEFKPTDILLEGLAEGISSPIEARSNLQQARALSPDSQIASAIQSGVDGAQFVGTDAAARAALSPYSNAQTNLRTRFAPEAPSADEAMASLRAATTVDDATSAAERLAGSLDDMAPDLTAPLVPRVTLPAVADLPPFDPSLPLMEQPGAGGLISGEIESQFGLDRLRALNPLAESPPIASTQPPAPAPTSTQTAALLTPPRPSTIRGVPTTQLSDEALQQIVGDQTAPPISRRSASIELTARQAQTPALPQTPALLSPPRTPQESSNGTPLDLGLEAARRDAGSPVVALAELGRAGMPDAPDGLLGGDTAGAQARARAQQSLDRWAEQNGVETPVKLGTAAPREEAAVNEIATALGSQFGGRVYAFSDPSNKVEGVAIDGAAFVNTAAPTISTAKTSLHEFKHTVEQLAKAETEAGLSNTAAQQFTTQIESIFDDIAEPGRRAYVERYLHKDELDDLFNPQTGKGSGTLEQREARLAELMSAPTTRSEMTADFLGNRATDKDFWNDIAQQDPQGFKGFVQKWIGIVDGLLGKLRGARGQSRGEAARVDYYVRDLQKAKMVAREALIAYSKSTRAPDSTAIAAPQGQTQAAPQFSRSAPSDVNAMGFYSALGRNVAAIKTNAAPAAGWKDAIKGLVNKGQAKAEEVEWSGVNDWLDMQQGKVTREQVAEYLRQGGVQVEETVLGDNAPHNEFDSISDAREFMMDHHGQTRKEFDDDYEGWSDQQVIDSANDLFREAYPDSAAPTKYGQYTLPGATNYREVLLTLPSKRDALIAQRTAMEKRGALLQGNPSYDADRKTYDALQAKIVATKNYRSAHWDQPNVLAHIRMNDRTDADGKRVLFVEEIQSDWGQEGKKKGFKNPKASMSDMTKRYDALNGERRTLERQVADGDDADPQTQRAVDRLVEVDRQMGALANEMAGLRSGVPAAPFVTKTEGWLNLALKRVITMAAEGGYDRVAFTTGEQNAERFSLDKRLREIAYEPAGDGKYEITATDLQGREVISEDEVGLDRIEELVGKEIAEKVARDEGERDAEGYREWRYLRGDNLKVEAKGMRAFYDTIVPTALKKLLPKVGGGQVGTVGVQVPPASALDPQRTSLRETIAQPGFDITPAMREKVATTGVPLFSKTQQLPDEGPMGDAQAQPPRAARGATKASPVQRGGTVEQAGEFTIRTQKDGTLGVAGDAAAIRAMLPEDVRGRVVPGGMVFTTSDAPRVRAALEGRQVAYSRAGQVLDKLPMKNGKYLGAPEKYNTPAKISTLRKNLRQLALEGEPGRYWYENSSREVLAMVGGNVQEARKFVALLAIYSPQAKVDANSTFALRAWAQYKAGQPINVKTAVMDRKAQAALDNVDAFWSGQKTGNFFFNLLREIDPTTAGKQGATIDMWMMRAGEYASDAPTATQYAFMENEVNRLAQELGWEPQQVQAAIWVAMKARMENPGVKKRTEASSEKKGWIRFDYPLKKGKPKKTRVIQNARAHRDNWLKHAFDHDPTKSDTAGAKFDFSDGLRRHVGQLSWEARPGRSTNVLPGVNDAPYDQQVEFQQAVQRALLDDDGIDLLAWKLGLLIDGPDILAPGVWQGEIAAGMQKQIGMAPAKGAAGKTSVDPAQKKAVETYAAMLGLLLRQEGVGYHRPFYKGKKSDENGVDLILDRTFTPAEAQALWGAIDERMKAAGVQDWENGAGLISSPTGMRVVNFGAIADNRSFRDLVRDAAETLAVESVELESFSTDGDLVFNDWRANPNGEGYRSRISEAYGPDLLDWARDVLAPRVQSVFDEFSARYGWGDPGQVDALFGERPQAGAGRAAEEVGPAAGAAADGAAPDIRFSRAQRAASRQRQTDTPEFRRWFGDSKVVDENGEPLVVYHGTNKDIRAFRDGRPMWFAQDSALANMFTAGGRRKAGNRPSKGAAVYPVYLRIRKPLDLSDMLPQATTTAVEVLRRAGFDATDQDLRDMAQSDLDSGDTKVASYIEDPVGFVADKWRQSAPLWSILDDQTVRDKLKELEYDGIKMREFMSAGKGRNMVSVDSVTYAVFEPTQIKSAIGNAGTFDPENPDIRFSRAQGQQPSAGNMISGRDELGYRTFGIGEAAYAKAAQIAENVLTRLSNATGGLVAFKPIDPKLNRAIRKMRTELEKAQNVTAGVASQLKDIPEDERQMISDVIEGELRAGVTPPPRVLQLAASISQIMSQQSAELVRLGMLTQDAAARWDGKYLPRFYEQKLGDEVKAWAKAARSLFGRTRAMAGIKGDSLKARGKFETVEVDALPEWQAQGWEVRDPDYDPASSTEVRIWRDFTKDERERMGEIRDAMFRFTMGYMKSQRDVALGRLYERLNADVASRTEKPGYVRVPQSLVEDTNARRYGKLAGRWVPREVMDHLSALDASTDNQVFALYKKGLAKWKEGKTVLNPVAHANNIVSNLTMAHFAGVSYWDVQKYAGAVRDLMRNNATVDEAKEAGLFGGTFNRAELIDDLPPQLKMLAGMTESKLGKGAETVWNAMSFFLNKPMGKAYDAEDKFFRFLIYREARARGLGVDDAVDYAQRFIFTYDNLPKGARAVRDFGLPFFGYTYKVLPVLLQTAMEHPLRMAAPAAILYATNAAMYALASAADGEDDWAELLKRYVTDAEFRANAMAMQAEERKNLPEWMKGNTALGTPKAVRLWTDAVTGLPMFLDVSRMVPSGDLFDVVNQAGGVPLPAPITPTNPVLTTAYAMFANKDTFKGKDVIDANDTSSEAAEKRSAWLWRQFTPALAVGNYHFNRTVDAIANATGKPIDLGLGEFTGIGRDGLPVQPGLAALQTVGIKARPVDLEMSERITSAQRERTIRELQAEIRQLNRLEGLGAVSPEAADRNREKQREKIQRLRDGLTVDAETVE